MDEKTTSEINQEDLNQAFGAPPTPKSSGMKRKRGTDKKLVVFLTVGLIGLAGGIACLLVALLDTKAESSTVSFPKIPTKSANDNIIYSALTGEVLTGEADKTAPAYCVQTPNGMDGARPQAGLNQAGVVFEAIAEAGITRFAAIYQNPTSAIIGPIRSLRIYYLQWDTPFDCTIVHAGGSGDALAAVASGGYKDLTEDYSYMYRGTYGARRWNNLFTTAAYLKQMSTARGYDKSEIKGFTRMTPAESEKSRVDSSAKVKLNITTPTKENTSELSATVTNINLRFGGFANYNVNYQYDADSNTYLRYYESGTAHEVYACAENDLGEKNPEDVCQLKQLAPSVVVAMKVKEKRAADNYHEDITAIGSGEAYIFQNGSVTTGTWHKDSAAEQIKFLDENGIEVKLAPGQTFVTAVPDYGSVDF